MECALTIDEDQFGSQQSGIRPSADVVKDHFPGQHDREVQPSSFPDFEPNSDFPWRQLPETIRGAVLEICRNDRLAVPVAVQATLSAVSVACQDLVLIDRGFGEATVCSLFMLAVSDTGARKTRADRLVTSTIEAYDRKLKAEYEQQRNAYLVEQKARQDRERGLQRTHATLTRKVHSAVADNSDAIEALAQVEAELRKLRTESSQNPEPKLRRVLYSSISIRELERALCENWPAAGLISNEAADFLNTRTEADMARLDRLWDGQGIDVIGRGRSESFSVSDPRLTMSLMVQPSVFDGFLERRGERAKGIGFIPRMLISRPETAYGERIADSSVPRSTKWIDKFNNRILELLNFGSVDMASRDGNRTVLRFSPAAQQRWECDHNEKEAETVEGRKYVHEREFVNRYSEHVARLAGLFHFFEYAGLRGGGQHIGQSPGREEIQEHTVGSAIVVAGWYLKEFSRMFNPTMAMDEAAMYVLRKLRERLAAKNNGQLPMNPTLGYANLKFGANDLRGYCHRFGLKKDVQRFNSVLGWLREKHLIGIHHEENVLSRKSTMVIELRLTPPNHGYRDPQDDKFWQNA